MQGMPGRVMLEHERMEGSPMNDGYSTGMVHVDSIGDVVRTARLQGRWVCTHRKRRKCGVELRRTSQEKRAKFISVQRGSKLGSRM